MRWWYILSSWHGWYWTPSKSVHIKNAENRFKTVVVQPAYCHLKVWKTLTCHGGRSWNISCCTLKQTSSSWNNILVLNTNSRAFLSSATIYFHPKVLLLHHMSKSSMILFLASCSRWFMDWSLKSRKEYFFLSVKSYKLHIDVINGILVDVWEWKTAINI